MSCEALIPQGGAGTLFLSMSGSSADLWGVNLNMQRSFHCSGDENAKFRCNYIKRKRVISTFLREAQSAAFFIFTMTALAATTQRLVKTGLPYY